MTQIHMSKKVEDYDYLLGDLEETSTHCEQDPIVIFIMLENLDLYNIDILEKEHIYDLL